MPPSRGRVLAALVALTACTVYNTPRVSEIPHPAPTDSVLVSTPVKAHLLSGETVVYRAGIKVANGFVFNPSATVPGYRYGLTLKDSATAGPIPLDSVMGFETFQNSVNTPASIGLTLVGTAGTALAAGLIAIAIFGSCPTVYTDSAGTPALEAEAFSYSIAPLFEARDVDPLRGVADSTGVFRLEIRNEAMETHYINQLGVLQVTRAPSEAIVASPLGRPLAVQHLMAPASAHDRTGRDVAPELAASDGRVFSTAPAVLDAVAAEDVTDAIDITFPRPAGQDSAVIVLTMRNSLLNTVLLYELMLGRPGLRSLEWIGNDLHRVGTSARLGQWYARHFGLRVAVRDGADLREAGRIADTGPIAWKDAAIVVPVPDHGDSLRVRLSFVADDWRIDRVALAGGWRHLRPRPLAPVAVTDSAGQADTAALAGLRDADKRYVVTQPGTRFFARFIADRAPADSAFSFLLVSQGYYIEWLRSSWVTPHLTGPVFQPTDDALVEALRRWRREAPDLEQRFYATRFAVR